MILGIYKTLIHFIGLTFQKIVLWEVIPLAIATILLLLYFQRYREERPGWNDYLGNSLVFLFVAMGLLRYIYSLDSAGAINFITYQSKSIAVVFLFLIGLILMRFNFEHLLPEKFAKYLGSTLTINLIAYAMILFVYTPREFSVEVVLALLILIMILSVILELLKFPAKRLFKYIEKEKEKERSKNIKEEKYQLGELKSKVKTIEKDLKNNKVRKLEKQKKEAIKLEKVIKKK